MRHLITGNTILTDNKGESMAEVLVAFTLLSIMLVIFFQGIAWATKTEVNASNSRGRADQAMIDLQGKRSNESGVPAGQVDGLQGRISRKIYSVDVYGGQSYTYVLYEAEGIS